MLVVIHRFVVLLTRSGVGSSAGWSVIARMPIYLMTLAIVLVVRERGAASSGRAWCPCSTPSA